MYDLVSLGKSAKTASINLIKLTEEKRSQTLVACAKALRESAEYLIEQNQIDIENAKTKDE